MKKFLEMIEVAKRQKDIRIFEEPGKAYKLEAFFHFAEGAIPFVFIPEKNYIGPLSLEEKPDFQVEVTDAPFKIFSMEMLGENQSITVPRSDAEVKAFLEAILVVEHKPKECLFFGFFKIQQKSGKQHKEVFFSTSLSVIVNALLKRLSQETTGIEHIRERVKIGTGKDKRTATFRRIVHVRPKKLQTDRVEGTTREIDWTHRWAVRGHWRKTPQLGKDREGNYCMDGFTWVSEHVKGPEGAPLIAKTRLVQEGENKID